MLNETQATCHYEDRVKRGVRKGRAAEARFKWIGCAATGLPMYFFAILFVIIFCDGIPWFLNFYVTLEIYPGSKRIDPDSDANVK